MRKQDWKFYKNRLCASRKYADKINKQADVNTNARIQTRTRCTQIQSHSYAHASAQTHTHTHICPHAQSNKYTNEFKHEGVNIHNAHKYNDICVHLLLLLALLCNSSLSSHYARLISLFVLFLFLFPDYSI